ncbi:hypothetical protein BH24DEI2_BH24DEI2_26810 [soil metagenome]
MPSGEILELSETDVAMYNNYIFQNSHNQTYSFSRISLEKFM